MSASGIGKRFMTIAASAAAGLLAVGLAGCSATMNDSASDGYDFARDFSECMGNLGWSVTPNDDGGVSSAIPPGQKSAYDAARDQCAELIGTYGHAPLTEAELRTVYRAQLATRDCLLDLGYDVPEPPSEQAFLDLEGAWSPYMDLPSGALDQTFDEVTGACPQVTRDAVKNG